MTVHFQTKAADILSAFGAWDDDKRERGYRATCPVHEADGAHDPSLIIDFSDTGKALVCCESRACAFSDIVEAAGLTPGQLSNVSYVGQTVRGRHEPAPRASTEQRATIEARAFRASRVLDRMRQEQPEHPALAMLAAEYGVGPAAEMYALGIGWESHDGADYLVVFTRDAEERIAWLQRRKVAGGKVEGDWLSARKPGRGTEEEARLDAAGVFGPWRGSGPVLIAEGASDGLTLAAAGRYDVIALPGAGMANKIEDVKDLLIGRDLVIVADNDPSGERMTRTIIDLAEPWANSTAWVRWANETKGYDVRDFRAESPTAFAQRLDRLVIGAERVYRRAPDFDADPYIRRGTEGAAAAIRDYVRALGYDLAFTVEQGWMLYDRTRWVPGAESTIRHLVGVLAKDYSYSVAWRTSQAIADGLSADGNPKNSEAIISRVTDSFKAHRALAGLLSNTHPVGAAMTHLQGHPSVACSVRDFDADPDVLGVANGVVELRTGKLRPMRASDRITRRLHVAYRPDAKAPRYVDFLRSVFVNGDMRPDEELITYMRRVVGYGITGHNTEQKFWLLYSPVGANGKSQFLDILSGVFREITQSAAFSTFEGTPDAGAYSDLAQMRSARLVFASEGSGKGFSEPVVKSVTGESEIRAKFMRQDLFSYEARFALLLATNEMPDVSVKGPIWRRMRIVEFLRHFKESEQVLGIGASIAAEEAEGVLAMAVEDARRWYEEGLPESEAVTGRTEEARTDADPLRLFLNLNVHESDDPGDGTVLLMDLWSRWAAWCKAWSIDLHRASDDYPKSDRQLRGALETRWGSPWNVRRKGGKKRDAWPTRWKGRRLISQEATISEYNAMRASALGIEDYANAGEHLLRLSEDLGATKHGSLPGVEPVDPR